MSRRFLLGDGGGCYHVVSRVVDRRVVFGEAERAEFRGILEGLLGFSGVECLTFCLMGNHFHLLLAVPAGGEALREGMGEGEFYRRLGCIYTGGEVERVRGELEGLERVGRVAEAELLRGKYLRRMFSLPVLVQELKRRFSQWYNRGAGRRGALWEERYRSVVVEGGRALVAVAAYIDLNPVRAGLGRRPGEFRWSGYGEALRGGERARGGLVRVVDPWGRGSGPGGEGEPGREWAEVEEAYRGKLEGLLPPEEAEVAGGEGSPRLEPRGRVRALSEGLAVGGARVPRAGVRGEAGVVRTEAAERCAADPR